MIKSRTVIVRRSTLNAQRSTLNAQRSTLNDFERIVVLDKGCIAQDGSPEMLTHKEGFYQELMRKESMSMALAAA